MKHEKHLDEGRRAWEMGEAGQVVMRRGGKCEVEKKRISALSIVESNQGQE